MYNCLIVPYFINALRWRTCDDSISAVFIDIMKIQKYEQDSVIKKCWSPVLIRRFFRHELLLSIRKQKTMPIEIFHNI